ncbi:unnamed protein product [Protopolystoma xenopodis]|uniref:Uncharacterized protein n=1 Tax=Protopolystoma xenopodis TaxID=117903 RepID=A0A3S5CLV8_9PLAT|nr:unnamed protein product [Protopolystoma xenopodis]
MIAPVHSLAAGGGFAGDDFIGDAGPSLVVLTSRGLHILRPLLKSPAHLSLELQSKNSSNPESEHLPESKSSYPKLSAASLANVKSGSNSDTQYKNSLINILLARLAST